MKNIFKTVFFTPLGILFGVVFSFAGIALAGSAFPIATGGTGVGGPGGFVANTILLGAGTSPIATTSAGTNGQILELASQVPTWLTASTTGTVTAIGLGFGATTTTTASFSTTTSTTNGITSALTITQSNGTNYNFQPSQSGQLTVPGGGTGVATLTGCLTGNGTGNITGSGTCVITTRAITINGTTNQITSSAGSQDLSTDRTWTLSLPTLVIFPGNASSTQESSGVMYIGGTATTTIRGDNATSTFQSSVVIASTTILKSVNAANTFASTTAQGVMLVNWDNGSNQKYILNAAATFIINATSSNPLDGAHYLVKVCQDGTGSRTLAFNPTTSSDPLRWIGISPATTTINATANTCTWLGFIYDGGNQLYYVASTTGGTNI